jgi:NAD(P)H dehydrogenase (quinone)
MNAHQGKHYMKNVTRRTCAMALLAFGAALSVGPSGAQAATNDRIIISGASGQLGGLTVKALLAKGVPAKNLILVSRTPDTLAEYAKLGAVTRFGDFSKPESLAAAYAGGTRMLLISIGGGAGPRPEAHKRAIDAAVKAGVKQIAYTSWIAISKGDTTGLAVDHLATEELLKKSGVAYTMLRNSIYMDVLVPQAAKAAAEGRVTLPASEFKLGYVTREDCAAAAAAVLATPGHDNKVYDITGPELIGQRELAEAVTAVTGKRVDVVPADPGAPPARSFGSPSLSFTSSAVADLTGRPAQSLRTLLAANKDKILGAGK